MIAITKPDNIGVALGWLAGTIIWAIYHYFHMASAVRAINSGEDQITVLCALCCCHSREGTASVPDLHSLLEIDEDVAIFGASESEVNTLSQQTAVARALNPGHPPDHDTHNLPLPSGEEPNVTHNPPLPSGEEPNVTAGCGAPPPLCKQIAGRSCTPSTGM